MLILDLSQALAGYGASTRPLKAASTAARHCATPNNCTTYYIVKRLGFWGAIERAFGADVDYGSIIKTFGHTELTEQRRYSPPEVVKVEKAIVQGMPDVELISTSHVEKQNHTLRMHCRRLSRLTNAFSKKMESFKAAVALHYAYYNFVKFHKAIRCTPAMEAGVTNSAWTVADLVGMIEA